MRIYVQPEEVPTTVGRQAKDLWRPFTIEAPPSPTESGEDDFNEALGEFLLFELTQNTRLPENYPGSLVEYINTEGPWNPFPVKTREELDALEEKLRTDPQKWVRLVSFFKDHENKHKQSLLKDWFHEDAVAGITWKGRAGCRAVRDFMVFIALFGAWGPRDYEDFYKTLETFLLRAKSRRSKRRRS